MGPCGSFSHCPSFHFLQSLTQKFEKFENSKNPEIREEKKIREFEKNANFRIQKIRESGKFEEFEHWENSRNQKIRELVKFEESEIREVKNSRI